MAAIHETMEGFYQSGAIEEQTMREFDDACLTAVEPMPTEEIDAIQEREHWLRTEVAAACEELRADPSKGRTPEQVLASLKAGQVVADGDLKGTGHDDAEV